MHVNMSFVIIGNGEIIERYWYNGLPGAAFRAMEAVITAPESYGTGRDHVRVVGLAVNPEGFYVDMAKVVTECSVRSFREALDACWAQLRSAQDTAAAAA